MTIQHTYIKVEGLPSFVDFDPTENGGYPTDNQLGLAEYPILDNQTPIAADPANWMIFDAGDPTDPSKPVWGWDNDGTSGYDGQTINGFVNPGARHPWNRIMTSNKYEKIIDGGPRDLGYTNIDDETYIRVNNYVFTETGTSRNEAWKSGSIELTLKPTKENCTILSGAIFAGVGPAGSATYVAPPGKTIGHLNVPNAIDPLPNSLNGSGQYIEVQLEHGLSIGDEKAIPGGYETFVSPSGGGTITFASPDAGVTLTDSKHTYRSFKVDLVNGIIRVSYEVFYGANKKYVEFFGKTNIVDGNWHHIIINRPNPFTLKQSEQKYGGNGCMEIWVDRNLEQRDYQITTTDVLPVPQVLFNDQMNPGVLNTDEVADAYSSGYDAGKWRDQNPEWALEERKKTAYVGGIRDYIFRQSLALSNHQISLNYVYAMLNTEGSTIRKAKRSTATANIVEPKILVNKKNILKLYWNNLISNKDTYVDGLELDEEFNVYSCSMTHKNIINPTQTFNLDLSNPDAVRKFTTNVRVAIGQNVFVPGPALLMTATDSLAVMPGTTGFAGSPIMIDTSDDERVLAEAYPQPWYINNLLFGGVGLVNGDRILLFNQTKKNENGIWEYIAGNSRLIRVSDIDISILENLHVYVEQGTHAGKTYVQTEKVAHIRKSPQIWREIDSESSLSTLATFPIHTTPWSDSFGNQKFIDVNNDIDFDYDIIAFMNYPTEGSQIVSSLYGENEIEKISKYNDFINSLKDAVDAGKSLYVSSPLLAVDLGIVNKITNIPQLLDTTGDAQAANISPFEASEAPENYFDTHRVNKYHLATEVAGLTDKETFILTDFISYSPNRTDSDYHAKYSYRQFGLQEGDEFFIPGLTTIPETLNPLLPGYITNQKNIKDIPAFLSSDINFGTVVTKFSNTIYDGDTAIFNPYDDYATTIAAEYGSGKIFVNCVEDGYAFSRSDYNKAIIQDVTIGENSETVLTAAWQYSTRRLNKKNLYDFSGTTNLIGQTVPTNGGGGGFIQAQSHCSNGMIRKNTNTGDIVYESDLYPDFTEEIFATEEIPVLSMTWLGLQWLAE